MWFAMARWLTKALKALDRGAPNAAAPEPFQIRCSCGVPMQGLRQPRSQRVECRRCGQPLFVLSADVYPQPKPKKSRKKRPLPIKKHPEPARQVEKPRPSVRDRLKTRARNVRVNASDSLLRAAQRQMSIFTPFRLVLLCIVALVAATMYWGWYSRAVEQAEITLNTAVQRGEAALREHDFTNAAREFQAAGESLEFLGRNDKRAQAIRQMLRESTAASQLLREPLFNIVSDAERAGREGSLGWNDGFRTHYGECWIVMQSTIERTSDMQGNPRLVIDYPLDVGGKLIVIDATLPVFEQLPLENEPRNVIFAAQLKSCRIGGSENQEWIVKLQDDTAFLWSSFDTFQALGFETDEHAESKIHELLDEQSRLMGIEP